MLTRRRSQVLAWLGSLICVASGSHASASDPPPQFADAQSWFDAEWARAARDLPSNLTRFRWETTDDQPAPQDLLANLRASVQGRKDHPQYLQLAMLEGAAAGNPPRGEWELWRDGEDFRGNNTPLAPEALVGRFNDYAVSPRGNWALGPGALDLADPRVPEPGYDYQSWGRTLANELRIHLSCGYYMARASEIPRPILRVSGEAWTAESRNPETGASLIATGRWIGLEHRGEFGTLTIKLPSDGGSAFRYVAAPAQWNDTLNAWAIPRLAWSRSEAGGEFKPYRTTRLLEVGTVTREEFERLTTVPSDATPDPVRGDVHIKVVRDGRSAFRREVRVIGNQTAITPLPTSVTVHDDPWLHVAGWVCLTLLALALIFLRSRRR